MKLQKRISDFPDLLIEWDYEMNAPYSPDDFTSGSGKKVHWKCTKGHRWVASIQSRCKGAKCKFCAGKAAVQGENDLKTLFPTLAATWDYEKNGDQKPEMFLPYSNKSVWWKGSCGHSWPMRISDRQSQGCPVCANTRVIRGVNDLFTVFPELQEEWDFDTNTVSPYNIAPKSGVKATWICKNGHKWTSRIADRARGSKCYYCSGRRLLQGYNDLETKFPELAREWHPTLNKKRPCDYLYNSSEYVWWQCSNGHEWNTSIRSRVYDNSGCRVCNNVGVSFQEKIFTFYLQKAFKSLKSNYRGKELNGKELDIFLPEYRVAIEYDGPIHSAKNDKQKDQLCQQLGIQLIRVRYNTLDPLDTSTCYIMKGTSNDDFRLAYDFLRNELHKLTSVEVPDDFDIERDRSQIYSLLSKHYLKKSLASVNPVLAKQWHPLKNGSMTPESITARSGIRVWWLGECGHEWPASVASRSAGSGCPICRNLKVIAGVNDLATTNSDLAAEWCYEKNVLSPTEVTAGSNYECYWKCNKGHIWHARISERREGRGCPYCSGRRIIAGENDLATTHPLLASEWDVSKNAPLVPSKVKSGSDHYVWWKCSKCGYEWQAYIYNRAKPNGSGCPVCANRVVVAGLNDLATTNPELIDDWNYEKNDLLPTQVTYGSSKHINWKCSVCGYEWVATINNRSRGTGCKMCKKRLP